MSTKVIEHCTLVEEAKEGQMSPEDFQEAVIERAGKIVNATLKPSRSKKTTSAPRTHKLVAVELVARALANHIIEEGAIKVAKGFGIDLPKLKAHAASDHISSC